MALGGVAVSYERGIPITAALGAVKSHISRVVCSPSQNTKRRSPTPAERLARALTAALTTVTAALMQFTHTCPRINRGLEHINCDLATVRSHMPAH